MFHSIRLLVLTGAFAASGISAACAHGNLSDSLPAAVIAGGASAETVPAEVDGALPAVPADVAGGLDPSDSSAATPAAAVVPGSPLKRLAHSIVSRTSTIAHMLTQVAMRFIGVPYVFGGTSTSGFDCSGYVQHVFAAAGIRLPRTADAQFYAARRFEGQPVRGDLVFFQTYLPGPSHVGIYLGRGKFVQASSSHGVTVSALSERYWRARFLGFRRVLPAT